MLLVGLLPDQLVIAVRNARVLAWTVRTVDAAIVTLQREQLDVLLVDERCVGGLGRLRQVAPRARVVIVSTTDRPRRGLDDVLVWPGTDDAVAEAVGARRADG